MIRRLLTLLFVAALVAPVVGPVVAGAQERIEVAQQRRTLWDMLFGEEEQQQPAAQQRQPTRQQRQAPARSQQQASTPPPQPDAVEKETDATRLAVLGDSLASDLGRALERFYAEDPNIVVVRKAVGSSGFVRYDFYDWQAAIEKEIAEDTFDIAVVMMGINDRQNLTVDGAGVKPLTEAWKTAYSARLNDFLGALRSAGKPVVWVELPPMQAPKYSGAITQISSLQRLAAFSAGAEYVDIYERFTDEQGGYVSFGPDLNGVSVQMRKGDGIHFTAAGADKLAFHVNQGLKRFYRGGTVSVAVTDPLAQTDAAAMTRPPFQGLGQIRLLEVAGAVIPLNSSVTRRDGELLQAGSGVTLPAGFSLDQMVMAPVGRADAFGVGIDPSRGQQAFGPAR